MTELQEPHEFLAIKCDKRQPCYNCATSKLQCNRSRQKRTVRQKVNTNEKIQAIDQRLSALEEVLWHSKFAQQSPSNQDPVQPAASVPPEAEEVTDVVTSPTVPRQSLKRKRTLEVAIEDSAYCTPLSDATSTRENEARAFIRTELYRNHRLSTSQRGVLRSALTLVETLSHGADLAGNDFTRWDQGDAPTAELSQADITHILMRDGNEQQSADTGLRFPDFPRRSAIKRIALAQLGATVDEPNANLHKVILHFRAAVLYHAYTPSEVREVSLLRSVEDLKTKHLHASLAALNRVGFLAPPSLLLLQALVTGTLQQAIIMAILGDVQGCLTLTVSACRTVVATGYHLVTDTVAKTDEDEEARLCIVWCYHFDKAMSMLLRRPPVLPKLRASVLDLVGHSPREPMAVVFKLFTELAQVQESAMELHFSHNHGSDEGWLISEIGILRNQMNRIHNSIRELSDSISHESNLDVILHVLNLDFTAHAIETAILRLNPNMLSDATSRNTCLSCARKALLSFQKIQSLVSGDRNALGGYQFYLSWMVATYPLCPFFVLFCHVVCTANNSDFNLMENISTGFSGLPAPNKHIAKLHTLCRTLVNICRPLVVRPRDAITSANVPGHEECSGLERRQGTMTPTGTGSDDHNPPRSGQKPDHARSSIGTASGTGSLISLNGEGWSLGVDAPTDPTLWDNELIWQLFNSEPSIDWYNACDSIVDWGSDSH
ncbi:hypothetical protein Asppvi_005979 [Aspergillus pseudoviridinutans]|uniref:Transcription factor domain-containing protein n=1 Tax=Aspergillus pseudoviridinutans TaxID=1517512 RepID=A0A9P3B968_9EURO|nr:uncharacterized protein Asppvi_005979 [Aspergillus pseudoviridinutans]GIJ87077.1 hypothetical protein Asppvi_005979 [Aspergillus pseudoviridinutans]